MLHLFVGALNQLEGAAYRFADDKAIKSVPQKLELKLWSIIGAAHAMRGRSYAGDESRILRSYGLYPPLPGTSPYSAD